jgi:hypothetical protein
MRPLAALLVCVTFIGMTAMFTRDRVGDVEDSASITRASAQSVSMEIVPTVPLAPDPFALRGEDEQAGPALTASINGATVLMIREPVGAGEVVRVNSLTGLIDGMNELYIEASPSTDRPSGVSGLRIRVLRGYDTAQEKTFWADYFEKPSGTVSLDLHEANSGNSHVGK